ncbi:MAG: glycoside hydrolase family 88 protein, partial [Flavobacteriales bacterium]|nr:glycoside hydrolase family 88 protein [Flavobacteriales bacterium]
LFWASKETGDSKYYDAAVEHANTTIANHFRADYSSYHVLDYDVSDGSVKSKETHQGYNDESDWARGQAWGLYGYTMSYRETNDIAFIEQAEKIASFMMNHPNLPEDLIPYWDLKDPKISTNPNSVPRDASAATVMASALIELSELANDTKYLAFASEILNTLSKPEYTTSLSSTNNFILLHSTGNLPSPYNPEINTSINYADYYYLEALTRYKNVMGVDFEPYTIYTELKSIDANTEFVDDITVYDIDNVGGFTVSLKNNPEFVSLKELGDSKYEIIANPSDSDAGNHKFEINIDYKDGSTVNKDVVYDVTTSLRNDASIDSKVRVYAIDNELIIEGSKDIQQITVYNTSGVIIKKSKVLLNVNKSIISIPYLIDGVYMYSLETTEGVLKGKFIIM